MDAPTVPVFLYDAFAKSPFGGNVAGVVLLDDRQINDNLLQLVAREIAAPTTGFVWRKAQGEFRVRFFTPSQEIDMCGHVVVGIGSALIDEGWITQSDFRNPITLDTRAGPIPVSICCDGQRPEITMTQRSPVHEAVAVESSEIADSLGLNADDLHPSLPTIVVSTALRHLIVPVRDLAVLRLLRPTYAAVAGLCRRARCDTMPVVAFANEKNHLNWRLRDLCPAIGNDEESASGTTNGAVGCYAFAHRIISEGDGSTLELFGEQGVEQGRPSVIRVRLQIRDDIVSGVLVTGVGFRSLQGEIRLAG